MNVMDAVQVQEDLCKVISQVNEHSQPVTLTTDGGKNAVLVGEDDWNAIQETLYLNAIPGMARSLLNGKDTPLSSCIPESEVAW